MVCLFVFVFHDWRSGLAGFFPLHPMTITQAERRKNAATLTEGGDDEEQAKSEQEEA